MFSRFNRNTTGCVLLSRELNGTTKYLTLKKRYRLNPRYNDVLLYIHQIDLKAQLAYSVNDYLKINNTMHSPLQANFEEKETFLKGFFFFGGGGICIPDI